jgi:predicted transcriptional regulator
VRRQPGGTQRAGAERRERMLALIRDKPGITVPELSEALNVDAPSLYRVVRKLQSDGAISKDGKNLRLIGAAAAG